MRLSVRPYSAVSGVVAILLWGNATASLAQEQTDPPPPQPDTTTVVEPIATPETPSPAEPPPSPADEGPKHVPPNASGIDLTTLETKNLSLLYFDPVQTYL